MSDDSSSSMPWFNGGIYNRVLAATPPEDSPPDFFYSPERTFVLVSRNNRPLLRPITPITPIPDFTPIRNFTQDGQRFRFSQLSPPALQGIPFRYSEMTQSEDSGHFTAQESRIENNCIVVLSPSPSPRPGTYAQSLIDNMLYSPSPPRESQMDEWLRSLSPDMFQPTTPVAYTPSSRNSVVFFPSPQVQSQLDVWQRSLSPITPSILNIVCPPEYGLLTYGRLYSPHRNEADWAEDGYNDILVVHMLAIEEEWYKDGADDILNQHMDAYENRKREFRKH
ncbi:uncharacterized protein LOC112592728 [Melanaphis sacchari]|uniref:uncharacterized protein LOC112592728 n=1 Tax=Melanaphis sacchari TaxID=742174 RepID=UPI000DC132BA|nr:uncharacterized protein LOC112592728 [Melanaphis sacchari]